MGQSEWGILITSQADLDAIIKLISAHNSSSPEKVGEDLTIGPILRHLGKLYLCLHNGGGRDLTSHFLEMHYSGDIFYPFQKPTWWRECQNYAWKPTSAEDRPPSFAELSA